MKRIRLLFVGIVAMLASFAVQAQMVTPVGLGVRLTPDGGGLSAKIFLSRNLSVEGQANFSGGDSYIDGDGPSMTMVGLLEYNVVLPNPSWRIFFGPGLHFGTWDREYYNYFEGERSAQGIFGLDGIAGVEYIFKHVPIGLSADVKPAVNFASDVAFFPNNFFGISGRFYFGHRALVGRNTPHPTE